MKINSINTYITRNINNNPKLNSIKCNLSTDVVSFKSKTQTPYVDRFEQAKLKLEAKNFDHQLSCIFRESSKIQREAFLLKEDAKNIISDSKDIQNHAGLIFSSIQSALALGKKSGFEPVLNSDGYTIRMFKQVSDEQTVIEEFSDVTDEDPSRIIIINPSVTTVYDTDISTQETDIYLFDTKSGHLKKYAQDCSIYKDGYSAAKQYSYDGEKLVSFDIKHKSFNAKGVSSQERFVFDKDSKLKSYFSDLSLLPNGILNSGERFDFIKSVLRRYSTEISSMKNQYDKSAIKFVYDKTGDLKAYSQGNEQTANGVKTSKTYFEFGEDSIENIYVNFVSVDGISADKVFSFEHGFAERCLFDYKKQQDKKPTFSKAVNI